MDKYKYLNYTVKSIVNKNVTIAKKDGHSGESTLDMTIKTFIKKFGKEPVIGEPVKK